MGSDYQGFLSKELRKPEEDRQILKVSVCIEITVSVIKHTVQIRLYLCAITY